MNRVRCTDHLLPDSDPYIASINSIDGVARQDQGAAIVRFQAVWLTFETQVDANEQSALSMSLALLDSSTIKGSTTFTRTNGIG